MSDSEDFGHISSIAGGVCFDAWGAGPYIIIIDGVRYRFEDSDRFGPYLLNKNGSVKEHQPPERSPFWKTHSVWVKQGRRFEPVDDELLCIYDPVPPPKPTIAVRLSRRNALIIENGDDDGEIVFVERTDPIAAEALRKIKAKKS